MDQMNQYLDRMLQDFKKCKSYQDFLKAKEEIESCPEQLEKLNQFRRDNYHLQCKEQVSLEELDALEREYLELCKVPVIDYFLKMERSMCRFVQQTNNRLTELFNFEIMDVLKEEVQ